LKQLHVHRSAHGRLHRARGPQFKGPPFDGKTSPLEGGEKDTLTQADTSGKVNSGMKKPSTREGKLERGTENSLFQHRRHTASKGSSTQKGATGEFRKLSGKLKLKNQTTAKMNHGAQ